MNLKTLLTANRQVKLFSLLLAVLLWLFVTLETADEMEIPLAINYINIPTGLTVQGGHNPHELLRIGGPRILLLRQKIKGVSIRYDLSGAQEGEIQLSGVNSVLKLVAGVTLVRLSPVHVTLTR